MGPMQVKTALTPPPCFSKFWLCPCICRKCGVGECRALQAEYDQLRRALGDETESRPGDDAATASASAGARETNGELGGPTTEEARQLRQHKGRLETRMRLLEQHNEQLDSQLRRLRQLLHDSQQVALLCGRLVWRCCSPGLDDLCQRRRGDGSAPYLTVRLLVSGLWAVLSVYRN